MSWRRKCCQLFLFLCLTAFTEISAVRIKKLSVPYSFENGTEQSVVLDCEYEYDRRDLVNLCIEWFLNDDLIYKWVPKMQRKDISVLLNGRIDTNYAASGDDYTKFRALKIIKPSTDLSGNYTCKVRSFHGMDSVSKSMVIYVPPSSFSLSLLGDSSEVLNLTCETYGIYPMPQLSISKKPRGVDKVDDMTIVHPTPEGTYCVQVIETLSKRSLERRYSTTFICQLYIPGTNYFRVRELPYYASGISSGAVVLVSSLLWLCILMLIT